MHEDLYLIAHKVRGEPALDVATMIHHGTPSDPAPWWIIPTSGHRAYPYWFTKLIISAPLPDMPDDLQDHYAVNTTKPKPALRLVREDEKAPVKTVDELIEEL